MGMGWRATSTYTLATRLRTHPDRVVRETPNVSSSHTYKTETKPRATWEWAGGQLQLTY
jgi:hypothetical protein